MINGKVKFRAKFSEVSRVSETRLGQSSKLGVGIQGEVLYYTALSQKAPDDSGKMITDVQTTLLVTRHTCAVLISCQCSPCDLDLGGVPLKTVIYKRNYGICCNHEYKMLACSAADSLGM